MARQDLGAADRRTGVGQILVAQPGQNTTTVSPTSSRSK